MKLEQFHQEPGRETETKTDMSRGNVLERLHADALRGESYEDATAAVEAVEAVQDFRKRLRGLPFASFCELFETLTAIDQAPLGAEEKMVERERALDAMAEKASRFSPRVGDLYMGIVAALRGAPYESKFPLTAEKISELLAAGDLDTLSSGRASWDMKLNRIEMRLSDYLSGARALDRREGREMDDDIRAWRQEELAKAPQNPPERRQESKPGVDPMERLKEGERAPAIWSITPAWGGYYKEQSFSHWDSRRNVWIEDRYTYGDIRTVPLSENKDPRMGPINVTLHGEVFPGRWVSVPIPYTHGLYKIETSGKRCEVQQDQNGDVVILVEGEDADAVSVSILLAPDPDKTYTAQNPREVKVPDMPSEFSEETERALQDIARTRRGNIARARAVSTYVKKRILYLAPKDAAEAEFYNRAYNSSPKGFAGAVDELKKADCDVANTYFAALCARFNIPVRHCIGHSVAGKDERGATHINSGTGHGWSEVWDETENVWVRMDATSAGDQNLEEQEKPQQGGRVPGDYGDNGLAVRPTDEQLEALRKKLAERKEELSYTKEERDLAKAAGVEPKEARHIVREIKEVESARLKNGELVVDVLARLFDAIGESRKRALPAYSGPVRRQEGGENISDVIRHYIGVQSGESDPMSRERSVTELQEEKLLHGMDVYVIGDKSGSVFSTTSEEGELLWKMQRRFEYLLFSSLYRFNRDLEKAHLPSDKALDVRTMGISFRGDTPDDIDLDKPLSPRFTAKDKVTMWQSLGKGGGGNGDVAAITTIYQKIKEEKEEMARQGIEDNRLRVVIAYSDGGYVGAETQMRAWAEAMSKLGVVVAGIGLTKSAATVPVVMHNPPKSFGEIVSNMEELTAATAKHIVLQAIKLFPEKARQNAEQLIEEVLHKFGIV